MHKVELDFLIAGGEAYKDLCKDLQRLIVRDAQFFSGSDADKEYRVARLEYLRLLVRSLFALWFAREPKS